MTSPSDHPSIGVAIPAAGSGNRMGGRRKAFIRMAGAPLLLHALRPFLEHPAVRSIAVALAPDDAADAPGWLRELGPRVQIVAGGRTRLHSVQAAIQVISPLVDVVLIHDAARPLVTPSMIDRCIEATDEDAGVVAGWPVADTLKEVGEDGRVLSTPDRTRFWSAQTPQAFPSERLAGAYERAVAEGVTATDDAEVYCRFGGVVRLVEGSPWNLKITCPEDLIVAEHLHRQAREAASDP